MIFLLISSSCIGQQTIFHKSFTKADSNNIYNLIGIVGSSYLTLGMKGDDMPELIFTDSATGESFIQKMDYLNPEKTVLFNVFARQDRITVVMQSKENNVAYVKLALLNERGVLIHPVIVADSSRVDLLGDAAYFQALASPDHRFELMYRIIGGLKENHLLVNYFYINMDGSTSPPKNYYIPFHARLQQLTNLYISSDATVYMGIYDHPENYRFGSSVNLYITKPGEESPQLTTVYLKEKKPVDILFTTDLQNNQLVLTSLYSDFYSKNVEGAIAAFINRNNNSLDTVIYKKFDEKILKEIRSGLTGVKSTDLLNQMKLKHFIVHNDQQITFVADLLAPKNALSLQRGEKFRYIETHSSNWVFNDMRFVQANTNVPRVNTNNKEADRTTNQQIDKNNLANAEKIGNAMVSGRMPGRSFEAAAYKPSAKKIASEAMVYKTIVLNAEAGKTIMNGTIVDHFYLPGSPFSNIVPIFSPAKLSLTSYELNKSKNPALTVQSLNFNGQQKTSVILSETDNYVFYQQNAMVINGKVITLYRDNEGMVGVAVIKIPL